MRPIAMLYRREWFLLASYGTVLAFSWQKDVLLAGLDNSAKLALVFLWLFAVVLGSSLRVVGHADRLAHRLGEPYGTLLLTLSVTFIEVVSIAAVMTHGEANPTLARDTMFAVVMIILNGMVGLSLFMGGWIHREQVYNLQGANSYLGVIIPLVVLSLVLPNFTVTTPGPILSGAQEWFLAFVSVGLYAAFLWAQTGRHHRFF
jgi:Ca2+:H+ antiporter